MMMQTKTIRKAVKQNLQKVFRNLWEILRNEIAVCENYLMDKIVLAGKAQTILKSAHFSSPKINPLASPAKRIWIHI
jgi:TRAP-type mannitol/chloroaromatic compound transport system permease small subunit